MASVTVVAKGSLLEGRVVSDGEVIVEAGAEVRAEVRALKVVIRGVIRGDVITPDLRIEEGGRLVGAHRTPAAEAAVAVAKEAAKPAAVRTPVSPQIADELAQAVALDTAHEMLQGQEMLQGGSDPDPAGETAGGAAPESQGSGTRRVVAVRRKG